MHRGLSFLLVLMLTIQGVSCLNLTRVMTFNILCQFCDIPTSGLWRDRLPGLEDILKRHKPDIVGIQELIDEGDVDVFLPFLPGHKALFFNSTILPSYPDAAIFYNADKYDVIEYDAYWLSEHPDRPFSMGWVLSLPRIVVWAKMYEKSTGTRFVFSSTHFDNNGGNKEPTAHLFIDRNRPFFDEQLPVIAVGDYNNQLNSYPYEILTTDPYVVLKNSWDMTQEVVYDSNEGLDIGYACPTGTNWPTCQIDHIFLSGNVNWVVSKWIVDMWRYPSTGGNMQFPSDHRAHIADVSF